MSAVSAVHVPSSASMVDRMAVSALSAPARLKNKADELIVRYDAWFLVLLAVLMVAAFGFFVAMSIWCFQQGKGTFSGGWRWNLHGVSLFIECR
ncbi:hypothetical protein [Rothia mucilaginosa]|uniref:hypothetical protein n=1 Tax=Rothia mucilaginosa TaxID=43675 RepID=UPI003C724F1C